MRDTNTPASGSVRPRAAVDVDLQLILVEHPRSVFVGVSNATLGQPGALPPDVRRRDSGRCAGGRNCGPDRLAPPRSRLAPPRKDRPPNTPARPIQTAARPPAARQC